VKAPLKYQSVLVKTNYTRVGETLVHQEKLFFVGRLHPSAAHTLPNAIFEHNLKTGKTKLLTLSIHREKGVVCCLDASDHWLVWLTYLEPVGDLWRVYAKNLLTGREIVVDKQEDANVRTMPRGPYLAVWEDKIVWTSLRAGKDGTIKSFVMLDDLSSNKKEVIAEATWPEAMGYVDIYKNDVVWSKGSLINGKSKANVYSYNLSSGKLTQVTNDDISGQPQIWGKYLVWRQGFGDYGPIIVENRENDRRYRLSTRGRWLRLGENLMLFDEPYGVEYAYDVDKNIAQRLPSLGSSIFQRSISFIVARQSSENPIYYHGVIEVRTYER